MENVGGDWKDGYRVRRIPWEAGEGWFEEAQYADRRSRYIRKYKSIQDRTEKQCLVCR